MYAQWIIGGTRLVYNANSGGSGTAPSSSGTSYTAFSTQPVVGNTGPFTNVNGYIFGGWNGSDTLDELYTYSFISNIFYAERLVSGMHPPARYRHSSTIIA